MTMIHTFTTPNGFTVLVGKDAKSNDHLTLRVAEPDDLWLHASNVPGSHVVIRTNGAKPQREDVLFAARLAAKHSKAEETKVTVDVCRVRDIRKPAKAAPGEVEITGQRTLRVSRSSSS
jgi:predicted ribosome quality control (RQC) complex YloA/Tae2 family protein